MVVDNEVFEGKAFENKFMVDFYGVSESFSKRVQSRDGCYVEQGWCKLFTRELKSVSRIFPKED